MDIDAAAAQLDGVPPLDDQVRLDLAFGEESTRHLLMQSAAGDEITGYAHVRLPSKNTAGTAAHVVVHPRFRRRGFASALLARLADTVAPYALQVWAHGDLPAARSLAGRAGLHRVRELWRLQRSLAEPLPEPVYPPDVTVRTFAPGADEAAWLAVNAAAFADHPEQRSVTADGLAQRMAQPDFDSGGFFLAERDGQLVGSHWTKVHPGAHGAEPTGEVYVLGVDPAAQGLGLGKALALTGLRHLADKGLPAVMLYVEGANPSAVALYSRLGFDHVATDVLYASSAGD